MGLLALMMADALSETRMYGFGKGQGECASYYGKCQTYDKYVSDPVHDHPSEQDYFARRLARSRRAFNAAAASPLKLQSRSFDVPSTAHADVDQTVPAPDCLASASKQQPGCQDLPPLISKFGVTWLDVARVVRGEGSYRSVGQ